MDKMKYRALSETAELQTNIATVNNIDQDQRRPMESFKK